MRKLYIKFVKNCMANGEIKVISYDVWYAYYAPCTDYAEYLEIIAAQEEADDRLLRYAM